MVFKKVTLDTNQASKHGSSALTMALSTISQAPFLIWMNILETYDGHNISQVIYS